jgi:APA family basic amino acid/polyamine antiporter
VQTTWSLSAVTVLVYYALANLCALRQPASERRYPRLVSGLGLLGCLSLTLWIEPVYHVISAGVLAAGLVIRWLVARLRTSGQSGSAG